MVSLHGGYDAREGVQRREQHLPVDLQRSELPDGPEEMHGLRSPPARRHLPRVRLRCRERPVPTLQLKSRTTESDLIPAC